MPRHPGPVCELDGGGVRPGQERAPPGFGWIILQRHGRRPLAVLSRALLYGDNRCAGLPWWSAVTIYETHGDGTGSDRLAVALCHTPPADEGPPWHDAWVEDDAEALRAALDRHDPLRAMPAGLLPAIRSGLRLPPDAAAATRFRAAWAGLLGALFGLRAPTSLT